MADQFEKPKSEFEERVVTVDRVAYTVAGGRRLRFRALVVVGNRAGKVGMGVAKSAEVQAAVQKAVTQAKKQMLEVPITNDTIPHEVHVKYGSAHVFLKPASQGTSVIAGGAVRAVIELAGIKNILSKVLGSNNQMNNVAATIKALGMLRTVTSLKTMPLRTKQAKTEPKIVDAEPAEQKVEKKTVKRASTAKKSTASKKTTKAKK